MTVREQIEEILVKDLPSGDTCPYCERELERDYDLDQLLDDLEELFKEVNNGNKVNMEG